MVSLNLHQFRTVTVASPTLEESWPLELNRDREGVWVLRLTARNGAAITGGGDSSLWNAFTQIWSQVEARGYWLCCAGARADAHMRRGKWFGGETVDILSRRTLLGIRHTASLFDYAPPESIGTLAEQEAHHQQWMATPRWKALAPKPFG